MDYNDASITAMMVAIATVAMQLETSITVKTMVTTATRTRMTLAMTTKPR